MKKGLRMTRRMYGWKYSTSTQRILSSGLMMHALRAITGRANDHQTVTRTTIQRDGEMEIHKEIHTDI